MSNSKNLLIVNTIVGLQARDRRRVRTAKAPFGTTSPLPIGTSWLLVFRLNDIPCLVMLVMRIPDRKKSAERVCRVGFCVNAW